MNKKISLGLAISLIIVSVTATFAITMSVSQRLYNRLITDLPSRAQMYSTVEEIDDIVRSNYYGEIDETLLNSNIEDGYVRGLGDAYSYYMSADEYNVYASRLEGRSSGIGVEAQLNPQTGYLLITEVYPNSPARTAGLLRGDEIVDIGGDTVTDSNYEEMLSRLSGVRLTSVSLTYRRDNTDQTVNIVMGYTNQSVSYEIIGGTGYIKISAFYRNTLDQLERAVDEMTSRGASSLIFDVRGTSDGTIEYASQVIDYLVPVAAQGNKALATLVDRDGKTLRTFSSDANDITMPMAVLINSDTSGFGELFACDLRDFGKAFLIGEQTGGNACVQSVYELSDGGAVVLTTSKMLPYISESFDGVGLEPDTQVALSEEQRANLSSLAHEEDAQLQSAISMLSDSNAQ